ncbi:MAG: periplasmic heavy metal sensor [Chlorobiaceae bacterium]
MKKKMMLMMMAAGVIGFNTAFAAADYSRYSDEELAKLRGTMRNAAPEERSAYHDEWQKRVSEMGPDDRMQYMGRQGGYGGRGSRCGSLWMKERLGLNDTQSAEVEKLRQKHLREAGAEREKVIALNGELRAESLKPKPDKARIQRISERIGRQHATLARLKSSHMAELSSLLTPDQRKKLETATTYCGPGQGRGGYGRRGGCGLAR